MIHTTEHVSGAENGAERTGNRLERSGTVSEIQKIKWSVSGAGAGGHRNGNGALSGQNLPLKIRSIIKSLKVISSKLILKLPRNCQCKFISPTVFVVSRINLIIWQRSPLQLCRVMVVWLC